MNIALVHDSFTQMGGAERVVENLHQLYPGAPVYTLVFDRKFKSKYKGWDIRTSWLQVFYNLIPKFKFFLPLIPLAVSSLNLSRYDLVISSSSGFAKNIRLPKSVIHVNYCHTPTRFLWADANYINQEVPVILRRVTGLFLSWMHKWDYKAAQRVTSFVANSKEVQRRISQYYKRASTVIYPGINTGFWKPSKSKGNYFLLAGRLQAHKKNDFIVEIFNKLELPLHVVGTGRQEKYLKSIAKPNIKFLGAVDDNQLRDEYSGAKALIYPQVEDFGLMPIEAAACGTPTIAYKKAGSLETVIPGQTGEFFESYEPQQIKSLIKKWQPEKYKVTELVSHAKKFDESKFKNQFQSYLNKLNL